MLARFHDCVWRSEPGRLYFRLYASALDFVLDPIKRQLCSQKLKKLTGLWLGHKGIKVEKIELLLVVYGLTGLGGYVWWRQLFGKSRWKVGNVEWIRAVL